MTAPAAVELAHRGWDTWNIEYRRMGQGSWHDTLADCAAAVDHSAVLADRYALDSDRVFILGHSAGGQLAAWCAGRTAAADRTSQTSPTVPVSGLVTVAGVLHLAAAARAGTGDGAVEQFLGGPPEAVPEHYTAADPITRAPISTPTRCLHSRADERVPFAFTEHYVAAATAAGDDARLLEIPGSHADVINTESSAFEVAAAALSELSE